jgi:hypothetical protein
MRMETQSVPNCTRFIRAEGGQAVKKGGKIRWIVRMQRDHPKVADTLFGEEFIALFLVFGTKPELSLPHDEFSLQELPQFSYGLRASHIVQRAVSIHERYNLACFQVIDSIFEEVRLWRRIPPQCMAFVQSLSTFLTSGHSQTLIRAKRVLPPMDSRTSLSLKYKAKLRGRYRSASTGE